MGRAGQTIHFVDHDHLDSPGLNIGQHALQRRPALMHLTTDERLAGLPLGVKRVERLL
jgi:hypothetical protein